MIRGDSVGLRAVDYQDLTKLLEWRNRPEYRCYFRENRELNWEQQKAWFFEKVLKDKNTRMFTMVRLSDGLLIGACGLCYIDWVNGSADFSIYIGHDDLYIDETLAPDAAKTMIRYGFDEMRLHRLWAEVYGFDKQKQAMFKSLGFNVDGVHPETNWHDGQWHDSVYFSMLNNDQR
jgi:hypothetical protein